MKTVGRILIILAVAAVIAGLVVTVVNVSGVGAAQVTGQGQFRDNGFFTQGSGVPGSGRSVSSSFSMIETIKNLALVALITAVVAIFERLLKIFRKNRLVRQPVIRE
jgi:hypothetical protein